MKTILTLIALTFVSATAANATLNIDNIFDEQAVYGEFKEGSIFAEMEKYG